MFSKLVVAILVFAHLGAVRQVTSRAAPDPVTCCQKHLDCCHRGIACCGRTPKPKPCCKVGAACCKWTSPCCNHRG